MKLFIFDTVKSACYNFFIEFLWEMEEEYAEKMRSVSDPTYGMPADEKKKYLMKSDDKS